MREPYSQLGIAYFRLGDYHKALEYYKKARFNADVANNMGILYYKTGDYEKALSLFQIAAQLNPNLANTYFNMGIIQSSLGNYQQAIEHLKNSIKHDAYHAPTYYHLGLIYQKNRDEKNARIQFSKAYQLDPRLLK
jgi:tetratricopeptide (TPR) repeat protein